MTGLLVIGTVAVVAFVLVLLGAPGLFRPLITYKIYFDNAGGVKQGAPVMLAGRKIGQVQKLFSPVSHEEDRRAQAAADAIHPPEPNAAPTPATNKPRFEVRVEVQVDKSALVYRDARVQLMQLGLLGDMAIDFTQGTDASGRARDGEMFAGERTPDLGTAAAKMLDVIKPVAAEATNTMKQLEVTAQHLSQITDQNSELNQALGKFKEFGGHLVDLTAPEGPLTQSLTNLETITSSLTENDNIKVTLQNFRDSSEKLKSTMRDLAPVGQNIAEFSETVKTQPWRLIWPSTKKPPEAPTAAEANITVRKTAKPKPKASPTPARTSSR